MYKILLLFTLFTFSEQYSFCQDSLKIKYRMSTIYQKGNRFILGSEVYTAGELGGLFQDSPDGLILYKQGYKNYQTGKIISILSTFAIAGAAFAKNDDARLAFFAGGIVINLVGFRLLINGKDRIQKAIWIRNGDMLFGKQH